MTGPQPIQLDSPRARLAARRLLREFGITSQISGDVLWVCGTDGQRMRVNPGEWLTYEGGSFMVKGEA